MNFSRRTPLTGRGLGPRLGRGWSRARSLATALGLGLLLIGVVLGPSWADDLNAFEPERIVIRSARHEDFARLVLDWPRPVRAQVAWQGEALLVTTERPFDADLATAVRTLAPWLLTLEHASGSSTLRLEVRPDVEVRQLDYAPDLVVLDFLGSGDASADAPVALAEPEIRIGHHAGYTRLVLDWAEPNPTRIEQHDDEVRLFFDRPGSFDLAVLAKRLDEVLATIERAGGRNLMLRPRLGVGTRAFVLDGDKVVVDFLSESAAPAAGRPAEPELLPSSALEGAGPRAAERSPDDGSGKHDAHERSFEATIEPARPPDVVPPLELTLGAAGDARGFDLTFAWSEPVPAAVFIRAGALWTVFGAAPAQRPPEPVAWEIEALAGLLGPGELIPLEDALALRFPLLAPAFVQVVRDQATWRVHLGPEPRPLTSLAFASAGPQGLVIRRTDGGSVLSVPDPMVGDQLGVWPLLEPAGVARKRDLVHVEVLPAAQGVVWRARSDRLAVLATGRELVLAPKAFVPAAPLVAPKSPPGVADEGSLADPRPADLRGKPGPPAGDSQDQQAAVGPPSRSPKPPLPKPALAATSPVEAADHQSGLQVATESDRPEVAVMEVPGRGRKSAGRPASTRIGASRWLDVARFATPVDDDVADGRMAAMARVAWAPTETRWPAQLDLARFLIAHDLGAEAMGVLLDGPGEGQDDDARHALLGAADFLLGRHGVAAAALARAALDGDPEIALWRAATAAEHEDWELAEVVLESAHGAADDTLTTYPLRLQLRLGLPIARVHARAGRAMEAFAVLDRLAGTQLATSDRRRVEFTRGLVYRDIGAIDAADRTWRALEQGVRDRTRLEVALARRMMLVDAGRMPAKVALRELDSLRPAWRGHPEEARQLDALAGLHASAGQIGQAIRLWQEALVRGVDPQLAEAIERSQRGALVEALLESGDAWVGPLRAYRLYQDFRQLLPDGREGMEIRQQLAARLATIDQIDPAAELLQDALGMHPEGVHRAELGAELAALWLDYPDPVRALRALKESAALNLPPALARERALLLARAALAVDDYGTAREAIASYDDREAARLRAEILWVAKDWDGLQTTLGPLVGAHQPSPDLPPDERRRLLVKLALANLAAGDRAALGPLQQTHQELVDGTAEEAQFGLVTALADTPTQPIAIIDAAGRKIGAVRDFLSGL